MGAIKRQLERESADGRITRQVIAEESRRHYSYTKLPPKPKPEKQAVINLTLDELNAQIFSI